MIELSPVQGDEDHHLARFIVLTSRVDARLRCGGLNHARHAFNFTHPRLLQVRTADLPASFTLLCMVVLADFGAEAVIKVSTLVSDDTRDWGHVT